MARLGTAVSLPGVARITATQSSPGGVYDDILALRYGELPSGGGAGKDYAVIVTGSISRLNSQAINQRMQTRWGLRFPPVEEPITWSQIEHLGNPLTTTSFAEPPISLPWQIVHYVQDWPVGVDLILSAQHVRTTQSFGYCEIDNVCMIAVDLTAFGGARVTGGWDGDRVRVRSGLYFGGLQLPNTSTTPAAQLLSTGALPWSSGTQTWAAFWSQSLHPKSAVEPMQIWAVSPTSDTWDAPPNEWHAETRLRSRTTHNGSGGALDGSNYYATGSFAPFEVTNATCSLRLRAGCAYTPTSTETLARTAGGAIVAFRMDNLDVAYAQQVTGTIADAIGRAPNHVGTFQEWQVSAPRDTNRWVSMVRLQTEETSAPGGGVIDAPAIGCIMRQNGRSQRDALQLGYPYRVLAFEKLPISAAAVADVPYYAARGGNFVFADWFVHQGWRSRVPIPQIRGSDRCVMSFALRDDGPEDPSTPPVFTRVVYEWDKEHPNAAAIPLFSIEPSGLQATQWSGDHTQEVRTPDGYLLRWGGPMSMRRRARAVWPALTRAELAVVQSDIDFDEIRCRRWRPRDEPAEVVWAVIPRTFAAEAGLDGGFSASCEIGEILWFGT